jgi:double-stranded uracil-DNA glycosylase
VSPEAHAARVARGFEPLAAPDARVLILGTIPSRRSLEAGEYYAHPRNAFWSIMTALCGVPLAPGYAARVAMLKGAGVALWDVLRAAERDGSLDAAIVPGTEVPNDIGALLGRCPEIHTIFLNGGKADALFRRCVLPCLSAGAGSVPRLVCLPSTSPANARLTKQAKLEAWRAVAAALADS